MKAPTFAQTRVLTCMPYMPSISLNHIHPIHATNPEHNKLPNGLHITQGTCFFNTLGLARKNRKIGKSETEALPVIRN